MKQLYYKRVRGFCAPEIKGNPLPPPFLNLSGGYCVHANPGWVAFAECAVNRTITATWVCRDQRLPMNACMVAHAKPEEEDRAREEWFATHEERKRGREEEAKKVEERREKVIRMMREDESRRLSGR